MNKAHEQQLDLNMQTTSRKPLAATLAWLWPGHANSLYDRVLLTLSMVLLIFGFIMVTSASLPTAEKLTGNPFHFAIRHTVYVIAGLIVMLVTLAIPHPVVATA